MVVFAGMCVPLTLFLFSISTRGCRGDWFASAYNFGHILVAESIATVQAVAHTSGFRFDLTGSLLGK